MTDLLSTDHELRRIGREFAGLPMPADLALCTDTGHRPRVRREAGARFPFPIPNGWFIVAAATELAPGQVMPLFYFGRDLVLFRTEAGEPRVLDAYCAHLGANLAVGGRVEGDSIACPFHGWCYDGATGRCTDVPYSSTDATPSQARVRSYPTLERNGAIWAWHHLEEGPPFYDIPAVPEFDDPEWCEPEWREFHVRTCCQEMAENQVDFAHFKYVHGTPAIPEDTHEVDGAHRRTTSMDGMFVRESFGLGLGVLRMGTRSMFMSSTSPIDAENVHVRWIFSAPRADGPSAAREAGDRTMTAVSQDIPIWENKIYKERPVLAKDERIGLHREWCKQFYSPTG